MISISNQSHPHHADFDFSALPPNLVQRLQRNGIHTLQGWRDLGDGRHRIFGITKRMAAAIDALTPNVAT